MALEYNIPEEISAINEPGIKKPTWDIKKLTEKAKFWIVASIIALFGTILVWRIIVKFT